MRPLKYFGMGLAAAVIIAPAIFVSGQEAGQVPKQQELDFQARSWPYRITESGSEYDVTLLAPDTSTIDSVEEALEIVKGSDVPAIMLAGNLPEEYIEKIKSSLRKLYKINPRLVCDLEPVVIGLPPGSDSAAIPNWSKDLNAALEKYANGKRHEDICPNESYTDVVEQLKDNLVQIPETQEEYQRFIEAARGDYNSGKACGIDLIAFSPCQKQSDKVVVDDQDRDEMSLLHEFGHLIFQETPDSLQTLERIKNTSYYGGDFTGLYVNSRIKEVDRWIGDKMEILDEAIAFWKDIEVSAREDVATSLQQQSEIKPRISAYIKTERALRNIDPGRLREMYKNLLEAAVIDWKKAELVADITAHIATGNRRYLAYLKFKENEEFWINNKKSTIEYNRRVVDKFKRFLEERLGDEEYREGLRKAIESCSSDIEALEKEIPAEPIPQDSTQYQFYAVEGFLKGFRSSE